MAWLFGQALFKGKPGRQFWWITPVFAQAKIAYGRMKRGYPANSYAGTIPNKPIVPERGHHLVQVGREAR
jgi:hypothetical protein